MLSRYTHGGDVYRNNVELDFSVNINPLGPPQSVADILKDASALALKYPDTECEKLKTAISKADRIPPESIICANGASEFINAYIKALSPGRGLILEPAFSEYERNMEASGAMCLHTVDKHDFLKQLPDVDVAFLCNPVNPTGVLLDGSFLEEAVSLAENGNTKLLLDESFLRFSPVFFKRTLRRRDRKCRCLTVMDSFTKIFAIPGLRLGFGVVKDSSLREKINSTLPLWNVSTIAQAAGTLAISDREFLERTWSFVEKERDRLAGMLMDSGMRVADSAANYLFFESTEELYEPLLEAGILIRDCGNYRGMKQDVHSYRVAVRTCDENDKLAKAIRKISKV